jgi:ABC-type hemin transport system ATPase subunit
MNEEKLRSVLSRAQLVLGNAVEMFPRFLDELQAPIAAISFDLDHYHSTLSILNELAARSNIGVLSIPRLMTYFDNSVVTT